MPSPFQVKLPVWEGPLDLLLELIRSQKMDIFDIPIHEITTQYLQAIRDMKTLNLKVDAAFLAMAATLLSIKAAMLLPAPLDLQESDLESDPRHELVEQLLLYERYKQAAKTLEGLMNANNNAFARAPSSQGALFGRVRLATDWDSLKLEALSSTLSTLMNDLHIKPFLQGNLDEPFHIEDKIKAAEDALRGEKEVPFSRLYRQPINKQEVVVSFWAVLELYKRRFLLLLQQKPFGDLRLAKRKVA